MSSNQNVRRDRETSAILHAAGIADEVDRVQPTGNGTINTSFRLTTRRGERWYLRIAPGEAEAAAGPDWVTSFGLRREATVIEILSADPELAPLLPKTVAFGFDGAAINADWVIQREMRGTPASRLGRVVQPATSDPIWRACGDLVGNIHAITSPVFGPMSHAPTFATWTDQVRSDVDGLVVDASRFGLDTGTFKRLRTAVESQATLLDEITRPQLIHSDLALDHVFVEPADGGEYRVSGVIDLEFARCVDGDCEKLFTTMLWRGDAELASSAMIEACIEIFDDPQDQIRARINAATALGWNATLAAWRGDCQSADTATRLVYAVITPISMRS